MSRKVLTQAQLDAVTLSSKGANLVVQLISDHQQDACATLPAGTKCVVNGTTKTGLFICVFPHSVLPQELKVFTDGSVRVIPKSNLKPLGRITL